MRNLGFSLVFLLVWFCILWLCASLQSCTATLRADKLWYNGNVARYPVEHVVVPDSL